MTTCLSSKVVSQNSETLAPIAVDAVLSVIDIETATTVALTRVVVAVVVFVRARRRV